MASVGRRQKTKAIERVVGAVAGDASPLRWADLDAPGYGRRRRGRGFSWHHPDGRPLRQASALERCRSLVVPPAWSEVWVCRDEHGHIQCTGIDARGRTQYRYHPLWRALRDREKFDGLADFARALPRIRAAVQEAMNGPRHDKSRVVAATVRLIDSGLVRVGNCAYARTNGTYGATTLRERHAEVRGDSIALEFDGKSGQRREVDIEDAALARSLRYCQELPGQRLFRYRGADGEVYPVDSADVNAWLREATGEPFTAKDFRTWGGTVAAWQFADAHRDDELSRPEVRAVKHVAATLGNTVAVARKFYVHPALLEAIGTGETPPRARRSRVGLDVSETSVLRFLEACA